MKGGTPTTKLLQDWRALASLPMKTRRSSRRADDKLPTLAWIAEETQ